MKKFFSILFLAVFVMGTNLFAQITNTVTFKADLTTMISQGFDSSKDTLEIRGLDWDDGANITVTGNRYLTVDPGNANIYQTTLTIVANNHAVGDSLRWKFHGYPENRFDPAWEPGVDGYDGRGYHLQADGSTVTEGPKTPKMAMFQGGIVNTVTFKADLTDLYGTGTGFFDPSIDGIEVRGFWDDASTGAVGASVIEGDPSKMSRNLDPGVVYETTLKLQLATGLPVGSETGYKFKTFPDARWSDGGWEIGSNQLYKFQADGSEVEVFRKPGVFPKGDVLGKTVKVLFQCDLVPGSANRYDGSEIPRDQVEFIILKGDNPAIGIWAGDWVAGDTLTAGAVAMYDNGKNGDKVAGDHIFSRLVTFSDTLLSGGVIYKFGAQYPGAGTISGSTPLDNSKGVGQNFNFFLKAVDTTIVLYEKWPTTVTSVEQLGDAVPTKYSLDQNYPNPFNPTTKIRYSIPEASNVTLKVFNVLGQQVYSLVNEYQNAGTYETQMDASRLTSGIYFYTLSTGKVTMTKKMLLLK